MGSPLHSIVVASAINLARGRVTADGNGTGVDITALEGHGLLLVDLGAVSGTTPTYDGHLEDSADDSSYAVIATAVAATQVTTVSGIQKLAVNVSGLRKFARWVDDVGGTSPVYDRCVVLVAQPKSA